MIKHILAVASLAVALSISTITHSEQPSKPIQWYVRTTSLTEGSVETLMPPFDEDIITLPSSLKRDWYCSVSSVWGTKVHLSRTLSCHYNGNDMDSWIAVDAACRFDNRDIETGHEWAFVSIGNNKAKQTVGITFGCIK